jgi:hypothetical protein
MEEALWGGVQEQAGKVWEEVSAVEIVRDRDRAEIVFARIAERKPPIRREFPVIPLIALSAGQK